MRCGSSSRGAVATACCATTLRRNGPYTPWPRSPAILIPIHTIQEGRTWWPTWSLYALAEVTRDPYPDPHDPRGKNLVADLRAMERLPRHVPLTELRANPALRKVRFLKNVRLIISPINYEEYQEILRMAGIVASPGLPLP